MERLGRATGAAMLALCLVGFTSQQAPIAQESRYLAGQFLVATPEMGDPRFAETVIYMISHDREGAMGLVMNRPIAQGPISDLLKAFGAEAQGASGTVILHYGGPVESQRLFILHSNDYAGKGTTIVGGGLAVTAEAEILSAIASGKGPKKSLLAFGYAGWAPGQLEAEIGADAWFTIPAEESLIFDSEAESKWDRALAKRKIKA